MTTRYYPRPGDTLEHGAYRVVITLVEGDTVGYARYLLTDSDTEERTGTLPLEYVLQDVANFQPTITREK